MPQPVARVVSHSLFYFFLSFIVRGGSKGVGERRQGESSQCIWRLASFIALQEGQRSMGNELQTTNYDTNCGQRTTKYGQRNMDNELWTTNCGQRTVYSELCTANCVQRTVYSELCTANCAQRTVYSELCTANNNNNTPPRKMFKTTQTPPHWNVCLYAALACMGNHFRSIVITAVAVR